VLLCGVCVKMLLTVLTKKFVNDDRWFRLSHMTAAEQHAVRVASTGTLILA